MAVARRFLDVSSVCRLLSAGLLVLLVAGCAIRPNASVLRPVTLAEQPTRTVQVLTATNRAPSQDGGFAAERAAVTYELYTISVPASAKPSEVSYPGSKPNGQQDYLVLDRKPLTRQQFLATSRQAGDVGEPVSLFVHGYNQSYQEALYRLAQVSADAGMKAPVILFAWPSEAELLEYVADKDAVLASRSDLTTLLADLGQASPGNRMVLVGHSMGGFLVMESLRELRLSGRREIIDRMSISLAAPDIDIAVFAAQLETLGRLREPIVLVVSRDDVALKMSSLLGNDRQRIGRLDVQNPAVQQLIGSFDVLVVDITSIAAPDSFGHEGYAALARYAHSLSDAKGSMSLFTELGLVVFGATQAAILSH